MSARDQILGKIRLMQKEKMTSPQSSWNGGAVFPEIDGGLIEHFVQNLKAVQGEVFLCSNTEKVATLLIKLAARENWENIFCIDTRRFF